MIIITMNYAQHIIKHYNHIVRIKRSNSGQGVIEAIVSLAIITTALIGSVSLATYTIKAGTENREKVIATNLAQEGLEAVRNIRDTKWIENSSNPDAGWTAFKNTIGVLGATNIKDIIYSDNKWTLDTNYNTDIPRFSRQINFSNTSPADNNKILVTCVVSWVGGTPITAIDILTNWKQAEKP